jgi:anti-sigma B factor antagonist
MVQSKLTVEVRRLSDSANVIDIDGDVTGQADAVLSDAYVRATATNPRFVLLNFEKLDFMNSSGIGVLVTLLVRAQRQKHKLMACGLNEHYRQIFELTRLSDAIGLHADESEALAAAG